MITQFLFPTGRSAVLFLFLFFFLGGKPTNVAFESLNWPLTAAQFNGQRLDWTIAARPHLLLVCSSSPAAAAAPPPTHKWYVCVSTTKYKTWKKRKKERGREKNYLQLAENFVNASRGKTFVMLYIIFCLVLLLLLSSLLLSSLLLFGFWCGSVLFCCLNWLI